MRGIRPIASMARVVGPAITVSTPCEALNIIKYAVGLTLPGDILVVSTQGSMSHAVWGGNLSKGLLRRGVAGLVIDGAVRDVSEIRALGFPVYARGVVTSFGAISAEGGEVNVPVACGGVVVEPGDILVCDEDGCVAIPPSALDEVMERADAVRSKLDKIQPMLERGEVTNLEGVTQELQALGLVEIDGTFQV